eukprot:7677843-Pyramimonas_sp.AAC.1
MDDVCPPPGVGGATGSACLNRVKSDQHARHTEYQGLGRLSTRYVGLLKGRLTTTPPLPSFNWCDVLLKLCPCKPNFSGIKSLGGVMDGTVCWPRASLFANCQTKDTKRSLSSSCVRAPASPAWEVVWRTPHVSVCVAVSEEGY